MSAFHPDLRAGRFIPKFSFGPRLTRLMADRGPKPLDPAPGVTAEQLVVPGPEGAPDVVLRVFRPEGLTAPAPALLWVHGGGLISGSPQQDDATNIAFARELGITVAAVKYRFAPTHPSRPRPRTSTPATSACSPMPTGSASTPPASRSAARAPAATSRPP